jgi:hypothetical protein
MFTSYASDFRERYKGRKREREWKMSVKQRKVALMGFRSVGKSSLAIQFVQVFP